MATPPPPGQEDTLAGEALRILYRRTAFREESRADEDSQRQRPPVGPC